ncbi:MAG: response regulator [Calditrichaeota bacterium]|nr:MAG: response regulator [Calditrichota bacterium]
MDQRIPKKTVIKDDPAAAASTASAQSTRKSAAKPANAREGQQPAAEVAASKKEGGGKKIQKVLVIEDDQVTRKMICSVLEKQGYTVEAAENGRSALTRLQNFIPDLFLLDLNMPIMNGVDFLRLLRKKASLTAIPVVVLTAQRDKASIVKVANLGIDAYIAKPVNFKALQEKIIELGKPEALRKRLENARNLLKRQLAMVESQERQMQVKLKTKAGQVAALQEQFEVVAQSDEEDGNSNGAGDLAVKKLKEQLATEKSNLQILKLKTGQALEKLEAEKKRLLAEVKAIDAMLAGKQTENPTQETQQK